MTILLFFSIGDDSSNADKSSLKKVFIDTIANKIGEEIVTIFLPTFSFSNQVGSYTKLGVWENQIEQIIPLFSYGRVYIQSASMAEGYDAINQILKEEADESIQNELEVKGIEQTVIDELNQDEISGMTAQENSQLNERNELSELNESNNLTELNEIEAEEREDYLALMKEENERQKIEQDTQDTQETLDVDQENRNVEEAQEDLSVAAATETQNDFMKHEKMIEVNLSELSNYETLVKNFYTIDSTTMIGSDQLNANTFMNQDLSITKESSKPQILIYHTHSQEAYADSIPGDVTTTIMGVGEHLAQILQEEYGYNVMHHTGTYDVANRDEAYSAALPAIEQVLEENPSIQVVIDLHRDEMEEETRLVMDLDGRPTARFMFFNGLSRTKKTGNISYLYNENLENNLAFSFQMQLAAAEYYPGLTRKIYLKGYRYNMHLKPRTLLIELGAQNNTVEEVMNACDPIADILNKVLTSESNT